MKYLRVLDTRLPSSYSRSVYVRTIIAIWHEDSFDKIISFLNDFSQFGSQKLFSDFLGRQTLYLDVKKICEIMFKKLLQKNFWFFHWCLQTCTNSEKILRKFRIGSENYYQKLKIFIYNVRRICRHIPRWDSESILNTSWRDKNLKKKINIRKVLRTLILYMNNSKKLLTN